jgi:hypothetical protein
MGGRVANQNRVVQKKWQGLTCQRVNPPQGAPQRFGMQKDTQAEAGFQDKTANRVVELRPIFH